ncbi:MAG: CbtB-domain containing protein [Actinomycetota bacterium]|nr:CbtB-domain containing protein [Actinomycetota bacterium]MBW3642551.1 CbtB-domain containing protein [Actinomycetota bacterium]MDP9006363.1 CbtB-domain containing protein [Actinomycetota bacterium]
MVMAIYAVTIENGAVLADNATRLHELFHDARHFIGVPCH